MFNVVEFDENDGGGVAVIRDEWLTPRKIHCMWPPKATNYNRCINGSIVPDDAWTLFRIRRVFYTTGKILCHVLTSKPA